MIRTWRGPARLGHLLVWSSSAAAAAFFFTDSIPFRAALLLS